MAGAALTFELVGEREDILRRRVRALLAVWPEYQRSRAFALAFGAVVALWGVVVLAAGDGQGVVFVALGVVLLVLRGTNTLAERRYLRHYARSSLAGQPLRIDADADGLRVTSEGVDSRWGWRHVEAVHDFEDGLVITGEGTLWITPIPIPDDATRATAKAQIAAWIAQARP